MITNFKSDFNFKSKHLDQAISLWVDNFGDSKRFAQYFIRKYSSNYDYIFTLEQDVVVSMAYIVKKKILIDSRLYNARLIVGVATKKTHSKSGLMKNILNLILNKYKKENIFMQADRWEYYKNWNFLNVSSIYEYEIQKTHKIKIVADKIINWSAMNKQFNTQGSIQYNIESFQEYIKMFIIDGSKIVSIGETYIVYQNNIVLNYAFKNLELFLELLNLCNINLLQTHYPIESKFLLLKNKREFTKSIMLVSKLVFNTIF